MIYLAIDTDVWLHLATVGYDKEHNPFDELCYWLETGEVGLIIPDHIIVEWERNKESTIATIKTSIASSVAQLKNIPALQDRKFVQSVFNSDNFEASARLRVSKIDEILEKHVRIAPLTDNAQKEASYRTLNRLAPSHKKDSFSDAVNVFSVLDYVRDNDLTSVIFVTKNYRDYSSLSHKHLVHPDLKTLFDEVSLGYAPEVDDLFNKTLRPKLSSFADHLEHQKKLHAEALQNELKKEQELLANTDEDFIINSEMLEHILKQPRPSVFQEKMLHELIKTDEHCRKYFFAKVDSPGWLSFMESGGYLDPTNHPGPIKTPNGTVISRWEPLSFLLRLSEQLNDETFPELTQNLINHVEKISDAHIDNDNTHHVLISILGNLPNNAISEQLLDRVATWFSPDTNRMFPTIAVLNNLLPKFLVSGAKTEDIRKAEKIIRYLLGVSRTGVEIDNTPEKNETSFFPNAYPWAIMDTFIRKEMIAKVAELCTPELFLEFARTVKLVALDYPNGLHVTIKKGNIDIEVKVKLEIPRLNLALFLPGTVDQFASTVIDGFDRLSYDELKEGLTSALKTLGLPNEPQPENEPAFIGLMYALTTDRLSVAGAANIGELNLDRSHSKHFRNAYAILLIEYLSVISSVNPSAALRLSETLLFDAEFQLPIFKRIILNNISKHFETQRSLLVKLFQDGDKQGFFDAYVYRPELFSLLQKIQNDLSADEIDFLEKIIEAGPKDREAIDEERIEIWRFRWCLALNQTEPFASRYKKIGETHQLKDRDGDPNQKLHFKSGTVRPMLPVDFLSFSDDDMLKYLAQFNPKDHWEEPNIDGLADTFKNAVLSDPERFISLLDRLLPLQYIYTYHLLYGFLELGRKKPAELDWKRVLSFCERYLSQPGFVSKKRKLRGDGWRADQHWVMGVVANLISDVSRLDEVVQSEQLLPVCERVLLVMNQHGVIAIPEEPQQKDYISHSYNSDNGKFLRACMDYCLCDNRINRIDHPIFAKAFKSIFEQYLDKISVDAFSIVGYYWQQFSYLDASWLESFLQGLNNVSDAAWLAFMGGFLFAHAPGTDHLLKLIEPQYRKAIVLKLEPKVSGTNGFAGQIASLYLWGMINLAENGLLASYLSEMPITAISALLHVVFFSPAFFESLNDDEYIDTEQKVLKMIDFLFHHYGQCTESETQEMLRSTCEVTHILRSLNLANSQAITRAIKLATKQYHHDDLLQPLSQLMAKGEPMSTASHLATIVNAMTFQEQMHLLPDDVGFVTAIIQFLYNYAQKTTADRLCNRLTKAGQGFAKEIYTLNNSF